MVLYKEFDKAKFFLIGNNLSLDFVNTKIVENGRSKDLLDNYGDLIAWAEVCGILRQPEAFEIFNKYNDENQSKNALSNTRNFREILLETVKSLIEGKKIKRKSLEEINQILQKKSGFTELVKEAKGFSRIQRFETETPEQILFPIAESFSELLSEGNLSYLKKCEGEGCILYFYDTTKNRRRRWCSMSGCGNRAKAAAFYNRQKNKI